MNQFSMTWPLQMRVSPDVSEWTVFEEAQSVVTIVSGTRPKVDV